LTNPENIERFQQEIKDIAQTVDNVPSTKLLLNETAPQAVIIVQNITMMIDLEMKQNISV